VVMAIISGLPNLPDYHDGKGQVTKGVTIS
jgi:hypothetical protein